MSAEHGIETLVADWLESVATEQDAAVVHERGMHAVRRSRPRPTWLAIFHGGTLGRGARMHHPAVRWVTTLLIVAALVAAMIAAAIVGARLLQPPRLLPMPFGPANNGSIVFSRDGDIWVTDGGRGQPRILVGGSAEDAWPLFAPDGTRFIFQRDEPGQPSRVMVANADGSDPRPIADVPGDWTWTDWSPDGRSILVVWAVDGQMGISILDAAGVEPPRRLDLDGIEPSDFAIWRPPNGHEIIFTGFPDPGLPTVGLYGVTPGVTGVRTIGSVARFPSAELPFQFPTVSPDGRTIAYANWEGDRERLLNYNLHIRDLDTGADQRRSLDPRWPGVGIPVRFTPDGRSLLFQSGAGTGSPQDVDSQLVIAPIDGGIPGAPLGPPYVDDDKESVDISPDGTTVILDLSGVTWLIDIATGDAVQSPEYLPNQPSWQRR